MRLSTTAILVLLGVATWLTAQAPPLDHGTPTCGEEALTATLLWTSVGPYGTASSPRVTDLTGDGVMDVVVGHGVESDFDRSQSRGYVVAIDGRTGRRLWRVDGRGAVFATAALADVSGDGVDDVFISGRDATLLAVDGARGALLWSFETEGEPRATGWHNFYSPALIPDQNQDGTVDLVVANGGDALVPSGDPRRPAGHLAVVSGRDGELLAKMPTPDGRETYMSPVVADIDGRATVVFGTGGETVPGSLWWMPLESLLQQSDDGLRELARGRTAGFIGPASIADFTGDGVDDVVAAAFDGQVVAVDGGTGHRLWSRAFRGHQTYVSPALGYVDQDGVPDVVVVMLRGVWPRYDGARYAVIDGVSGHVIWHRLIGDFAMSGALAVDLTGDGRDEAVFPVRQTDPPATQLFVSEVGRPAEEPRELAFLPGGESPSAPWIGDLDGDGCLDLLVTHSSAIVGYSSTAITARYLLGAAVPEHISWGAYLGTKGDGRLH